ncbi:MAG: citrate synthase family protein [Caldilineaceae bacterium]|nr:citrate synthase family protein [Caldilineaceae bacterium]
MNRRYYTAREAAETLGISRATLYAYVSRGLVRSEETGGDSRTRRYNAEDVDRLLARKAQRADPTLAAQQALDWGTPILESALTLIAEGHFYYRGQDATELARVHTLEEVAGLFWADDLNADLFGEPFALSERLQGVQVRVADLRAVERMQGTLIVATGEDPGAFDLRPQAVMRSGVRILRLLACGATSTALDGAPIALSLQQRWARAQPAARALFDAAMVLCADHELNVSAFTARCVASAGSSPYAAVIAGLSALQGIRHGGYTERVEALLREVATPERSAQVLAERLRRRGMIPGFGLRIYPDGDPRARLLLSRIEAAFPDHPDLHLSQAVCIAARELTGEEPSVDFALATLSRVLTLPDGAALALFALGRAVGWIGHAIEQYAAAQLIRPRARYTGRVPGARSA